MHSLGILYEKKTPANAKEKDSYHTGNLMTHEFDAMNMIVEFAPEKQARHFYLL